MGCLEEQGYDLRRPIGDYLRDDIYELRSSLQGIHYRILYFFHDDKSVVFSHGLIKEREVPPKEIERAIENKNKFSKNPEKHTYEEKQR